MDGLAEKIDSYINTGAMDASLQAFVSGFTTFVVHGGITVAILLVALVVYSKLTPYRELDLVKDNNIAAGLTFGGSVLSLAIPLSFAMATSLNWADIVIWGVVTVLVQLFALRLVDLLLPGLPERIKHGEVSAACVLVSMKLAFAFILAAAVAGAPLAR